MSAVPTTEIQEFNPDIHLTDSDIEKRFDAFHRELYTPGEMFYWPKNYARKVLWGIQNQIPIPKPNDWPLFILSVVERCDYDGVYYPEELEDYFKDYFQRVGLHGGIMKLFENLGGLYQNLPVLWIKVKHSDGNDYWIMKQHGNNNDDSGWGSKACPFHPKSTWRLGGLYDLPSPNPKSNEWWIDELIRVVPSNKEE